MDKLPRDDCLIYTTVIKSAISVWLNKIAEVINNNVLFMCSSQSDSLACANMDSMSKLKRGVSVSVEWSQQKVILSLQLPVAVYLILILN